TPTNLAFLHLGRGTTGVGTYTLTGGTLNANNLEYVGEYGHGTFVQTGGTNAVHFDGGGSFEPQLIVGYQPRSSGNYTLTGGTLDAGVFEIGFNGTGAVNHSGGNVTAQVLYVAINPGATATYAMSNGASLVVTDAEIIGEGAAGTFIQTGGAHVVGSG